MAMEWTPEIVQVEVDRRREVARHSALVRALRDSQGARPSWWRRLRSHPEPGDRVDQADRVDHDGSHAA
jgi:hypothetical protein